ncbi:MAG: hypothetical protein CMJ35_15895 [Phycisphaerae bacterium]|nr:hypothetical protein [Phycisphaerae bacterium]MBM93070.1 hypothetical protein [Phycisphaerae bacterium]HCT43879.1 hypothetical protein [Phycisphaerales bacterium]
MHHQSHNTTIVLDSKTAEPIGIRYRADHSTDQSHTNRSVGEHDAIDGEVPKNSPESHPAHPQLKPKALVLLMISVLFVVIIAAIVVGAFWGFAPGALVLVFGTGLLFVGNPEIWATTQRAKEREHTED